MTQGTFALESHIDEVARTVGMDPLTFRSRNLLEEGEDRSNGRGPIDTSGVTECLERGQRTFERITDDRSSSSNELVGRGVALGTHTTGSGAGDGRDVSEAELTMRTDGTVTAKTAGVELGQGRIPSCLKSSHTKSVFRPKPYESNDPCVGSAR